MRYLTAADLLLIHESLLYQFGGMSGVTEAGYGRLEGAVAVPQQSAFGAEVYESVAEKAAALCVAISRAHPFSDGNKRVALVAMDLFLTLNGHTLHADNNAAYEAMIGLAAGEIDRDGLIAWVQQHTRG